MTPSLDELKLNRKLLIHGWYHNPIVVSHGRGSTILDSEGKEYLDCTSQAWTINVGFQHPRVIEAVVEQAKQMYYVNPVYDSIPLLTLAGKIAAIAPGNLKRPIFSTSGSEAVEVAVQIAMRFSKGQTVVTLFDCFHGRTFLTRAASHLNSQKIGFERFCTGFVKVPNYYCFRCPLKQEYPSCELLCAEFVRLAFEKMSEGKISAVLLEPIQGNGGQIPAPSGYLQKVRKICTEFDTPLVFDEVQTGFGRTGKMFAADFYDVVPDIMAIGKGFSSGFPLSAALVSDKYDVLEPGDFAITNAANPVACAAASATIDVLLEERLPDNAAKIGAFILGGLRDLSEEYQVIGDVRGMGLLIGVELVRDRKTRERAIRETEAVLRTSFKKGIIFGTAGIAPGNTNVIKIKPPLCVTQEEAERVLSVFEESLRENRLS